MKASRIVLAGLALGAGLSLAGCVDQISSGAGNLGVVSTNTRPGVFLSSNEQAERCVTRTDMKEAKIGYGGYGQSKPDDNRSPAPQIMTYDPHTGTETHTNTYPNDNHDGNGNQYSFSARNRLEQTGVGIKGSTEARSGNFKVCRENGPDHEIDPVVAASLIGTTKLGYDKGYGAGKKAAAKAARAAAAAAAAAE